MKKILIIEDSKAFSQIIAASIRDQLHIDCDIVTTSQEAIDLLDHHKSDYLAITADLNHPGSPNGEIIKKLEPYELPCLVLTGEVGKTKKKEITESKIVCDYLNKNTPGAFDNIVSQIKRLVNNMHIKALVVEDSLPMRELISSILKAHNITPICVDNAESALIEIAKTPSIKLIITDGEMQGKNGVELTYEIRKTHSTQDMVIIGISGVYSRDKSIAFIKAGANDFLTKPIIVEELVARINHNLNVLDYLAELRETTEYQRNLLHMAAHDIRNPLGNIFSLTNLLLSDNPIEIDKCNKFIPLINKTSENLIQLLTRLTQYASVSQFDLSTNKEVACTEQLIRHQLDEYKSLAIIKGIKLNFDVQPNVRIDCDEILIRQVIHNLISNAIKYSRLQTEIYIKSRLDNNAWLFQVIDSGHGIPQNEEVFLFKAFTRLSTQPTNNETSTGLGLAISKKIIQAHAGEINYEPRKDAKGSCFYFNLPLAFLESS
ncbi:hybrid sensor histidine kinase/response regulator [Algibacillus agarilyticus]|uniref:hybrid sensor histidine kinase/response regulator n=1 Tax=Algibacillus agarilyticus TaxID=2234133 RepID=UPI000DD024D5|nr:hybrid sensor histidine kinase/response regulator [Algibacillus agarilyticus]